MEKFWAGKRGRKNLDSALLEFEVGGCDEQPNVEVEEEFSHEDRNLALVPLLTIPEYADHEIDECTVGFELRKDIEEEEDEEDEVISECVLQRVKVVSGLVGLSFVGLEDKVKKPR
ncbi:hypothetical protein CDL15_Pgr012585 [Punica granatum]|uniref:Uncharacterized protein n=1 Tax=Punica granatum TaxID=22663 RepID=A0A218XYR7_PUNGR|nr:hypothetical protein CDL15_Pgr012585 [Punica granatum]